MTYIKRSIFFLLVSVMLSCTDTIDVDVPNGGERLVVEASINWEKGTSGQNQVIKLSKSTAYFNPNSQNIIIGAIVTVTKDNDGAVFNFVDQGDGNYITSNFIPEINQSYSLEVLYNGQTYIANETMAAVTTITNIEQTISEGFSEDEIEVVIYFDDPEGIDNFYLTEFIPSHSPLLELVAYDDEFTDGNEINIEYEDEDFEPGVIVDVNLYGITERYYNYINLLIEQQDSDGPFQTTPTSLQGNCKNSNNVEEEVLGFFKLSEFVKTTHIIE